ncbi:MAG: hypothetical protein PSV46_22255 [Reyranella sp.]|nr:hypothetical protein [Reyranella sp.]
MKKISFLLVLVLALAACHDKATLDQSQVEYMTLEERKYEIRVASAGVPDEYRLLIVRATLVINPDPEAERARNQNVANRVMDRTCKGRPVRTLENNLVDELNLEIRFRCLEVRGG